MTVTENVAFDSVPSFGVIAFIRSVLVSIVALCGAAPKIWVLWLTMVSFTVNVKNISSPAFAYAELPAIGS